MKITRTSMFSGQVHTMDLPITLQQLVRYENGALVQDAFPDLNGSEREFIMTGVTPEEWHKYMVLPEDNDHEPFGLDGS